MLVNKHRGIVFFALLAVLSSIVGSAKADDWVAVKLRGAVFALDSGVWVQLERGAVVSDSRVIRTAKNGRAQFRRDNEVIDLSPNTQIKIFDRAGQKFTVVQQHFGEVAIEADRRDVQHFAVQTKYLAAVVKGTTFTVTADDNGADVAVKHGQVQVRDTDRYELVNVDAGQSAKSGRDARLKVAGPGELGKITKYKGTARSAKIEIMPTKNKHKNNTDAVEGRGAQANSSKKDKSGDADKGNSGNGNSGNGNSGNGNSGNGNSGNGNSGNKDKENKGKNK